MLSLNQISVIFDFNQLGGVQKLPPIYIALDTRLTTLAEDIFLSQSVTNTKSGGSVLHT